MNAIRPPAPNEPSSLGRATTPQKKREMLLRLYASWLEHPEERLGQFISNSTYLNTSPLYYLEDADMVFALETYDENR